MSTTALGFDVTIRPPSRPLPGVLPCSCRRSAPNRLTLYCSNCGGVANAEAPANPDCAPFHGEYAEDFRYRFCPDCRTLLSGNRRKKSAR